jgi:hypothetical protein
MMIFTHAHFGAWKMLAWLIRDQDEVMGPQSILTYNKVMCECSDLELSMGAFKELKLDTLEMTRSGPI